MNLLIPPIAFLIYLLLVGILSGVGRMLAPQRPNPAKTSTYASGEEADGETAVPGYRPFFLVALFFAVLHLGVLMLGSSNFSPMSLLYLAGLLLTLVALILG